MNLPNAALYAKIIALNSRRNFMKKLSKVLALLALTCVWGGAGAHSDILLQQF